MKRSAILGVLALMIAVFSMSLPAWAQSGKVVFQAPFVPGMFPTASEAGFIKGGVQVYADGTVEISIVGAQPNEVYNVLMGFLSPISYQTTDMIVVWAPMPPGPVLQLTTDGKGKGTAMSHLAEWQYGPHVAFALDDADNDDNATGPNRYLTGVLCCP